MLTIDNLVKEFQTGRKEDRRRVRAIDDLCLQIEDGELFTLLGPSGCGKTTTLRSIAGLETPDSGQIDLNGTVFFSSRTKTTVPANRRELGMVFQSYAIWPHMNVFDNVAFPLTVLPRRRRPSRKEIAVRVERCLDVVQLGALASRPSTDLSGGQQQRLALARALVTEPPVLLLDEPLSNLDAKLREGMRLELKRLQRQLGITSVYVTHDQVEALAMSSRIAVMKDGALQQLGRPREVYENPATRFVADFIGTSNFLDGTVSSRADGRMTVITTAGPVVLQDDPTRATGEAVVLAIRPEDVAIRRLQDGEGAPDGLAAQVETRAFLGEAVEHLIRIGDTAIRSRCHPSISLPERTEVAVTLSPDGVSVLPAQ